MARRGLKDKVKVKVMGQADAVGPTSIEGSLFSSFFFISQTVLAVILFYLINLVGYCRR